MRYDSAGFPLSALSRRALLTAAGAAAGSVLLPDLAFAKQPFDQWVESFRPRAQKRGISDATYSRVMKSIQPDTSVYALDQKQDEFHEDTWQYLNRRVSDWRVRTGKEKLREHSALLSRIEREFGVDRYTIVGLWGMESAFGDVVLNPKHQRPIIPALAALAWGDARRRTYWEQELLNALVIVDRGWAQPQEMQGSWAGAMGHTAWMPEVWLNIGKDYDGDGRISPYSIPDALAGTARYLISRGKYVKGQDWGCEVRVPPGIKADRSTTRSLDAWKSAGVQPAGPRGFPRLGNARLWQPVDGGPAFLIGQNFLAVRSYNPSFNYALAIVHLGDRIRGDAPFAQQFPGGERALTLPEIQEVQQRLTRLGFDTGGTDGRVGRDTMVAIRNFQKRAGLAPADGYAGLKVLTRLRQGL
ncbi:lytic murein transglycosylase [Variibacter gotjawalensis]|nr:lytic murein transglycosylase [Variibacter gotjawalensis]